MSISHLLEDFSDTHNTSISVKPMTEDALEELRLTAFEQGYSAGWEDAIAAQSSEQGRISAELARNLEDLSFTYHEALTQMLAGLRPLFHALTETVLPELMAQTFAGHIVEQLCDMAQEQGAQSVVLSVPSGVASTLKPILDQGFTMPVQIVEDPGFVAGQAGLRIGAHEQIIDCEHLLTTIRDNVEAFFYQTNKEIENGRAV